MAIITMIYKVKKIRPNSKFFATYLILPFT